MRPPFRPRRFSGQGSSGGSPWGTGEVLWSNNQALSYSPQASSSGNPLADLLVQAIVSAVEKAKPNYIPLTQQANLLATHVVGQGLPAGPYLPAQHQTDQKSFPN